MTDHDALLAAILADPAEDTVRKVYADWLQENGQPERAEFIRVQVELARLDSGEGEPISDIPRETDAEWKKRYRRIDDLRRRERELICPNGRLSPHCQWFPEFGKEWTFKLGSFPGECNNPSTRVSRGFVSALICTWDAWRIHADAILARQPIERVRLTTIPNADVFIAPISAVGCEPREYFIGCWPDIAFELPAEERLMTDDEAWDEILRLDVIGDVQNVPPIT